MSEIHDDDDEAMKPPKLRMSPLCWVRKFSMKMPRIETADVGPRAA
jgi:hypothetical protein